jgi:hypothetical protein
MQPMPGMVAGLLCAGFISTTVDIDESLFQARSMKEAKGKPSLIRTETAKHLLRAFLMPIVNHWKICDRQEWAKQSPAFRAAGDLGTPDANKCLPAANTGYQGARPIRVKPNGSLRVNEGHWQAIITIEATKPANGRVPRRVADRRRRPLRPREITK